MAAKPVHPKPHFVLVGFLDEMGSRERYKKLLDMQDSADALEKRNAFLVQELKWIGNARRQLVHSLKSHQKPTLFEEIFLGNSAEGKNAFRKPHVHVSVFSDSLLLHFKLDGTAEGVLGQLNAVLGTVSVFFLQALCQGHVYRGALEVSSGASLGARGVVGPAMSEAFRLESEEASFPRVMIGPELARLIENVAGVPSGALFVYSEGQVATRLICKDEAGKWMLNFLYMPKQIVDSNRAAKAASVKALILKSYNKIVSWEAEFDANDCPHIRDKYSSLRTFFETQLSDANWFDARAASTPKGSGKS